MTGTCSQQYWMPTTTHNYVIYLTWLAHVVNSIECLPPHICDLFDMTGTCSQQYWMPTTTHMYKLHWTWYWWSQTCTNYTIGLNSVKAGMGFYWGWTAHWSNVQLANKQDFWFINLIHIPWLELDHYQQLGSTWLITEILLGFHKSCASVHIIREKIWTKMHWLC